VRRCVPHSPAWGVVTLLNVFFPLCSSAPFSSGLVECLRPYYFLSFWGPFCCGSSVFANPPFPPRFFLMSESLISFFLGFGRPSFGPHPFSLSQRGVTRFAAQLPPADTELNSHAKSLISPQCFTISPVCHDPLFPPLQLCLDVWRYLGQRAFLPLSVFLFNQCFPKAAGKFLLVPR